MRFARQLQKISRAALVSGVLAAVIVIVGLGLTTRMALDTYEEVSTTEKLEWYATAYDSHGQVVWRLNCEHFSPQVCQSYIDDPNKDVGVTVEVDSMNVGPYSNKEKASKVVGTIFVWMAWTVAAAGTLCYLCFVTWHKVDDYLFRHRLHKRTRP